MSSTCGTTSEQRSMVASKLGYRWRRLDGVVLAGVDRWLVTKRRTYVLGATKQGTQSPWIKSNYRRLRHPCCRRKRPRSEEAPGVAANADPLPGRARLRIGGSSQPMLNESFPPTSLLARANLLSKEKEVVGEA